MLQGTVQAYVILRPFSALPIPEPIIMAKELQPEAAAVISAATATAMVQGVLSLGAEATIIRHQTGIRTLHQVQVIALLVQVDLLHLLLEAAVLHQAAATMVVNLLEVLPEADATKSF